MLYTPHSQHPHQPSYAFEKVDGIAIRTVAASEVPEARRLAHHPAFAGDRPAPPRPPAADAQSASTFAWVAEKDSRVVGLAFGRELPGGVAHVCAPRVHAQYRRDEVAPHLARAALDALRDRGALKIVLHTPNPPESVIPFARSAGFNFHRAVTDADDPRIEFYTDLYARPPKRDACSA